MGSDFKDKVIISVGGSLIVPNGGIDTKFLSNLNSFIRKQLGLQGDRPHSVSPSGTLRGKQFFLITGGGSIARHYRDAGREVIGHELTRDDLDWLGIHATKLNAHLVRTIFRDIAHPYIVKHYEIIRKVTEPVVVCAGWKPGWSTDYCSILVAQDYQAKTIINLSNIKQVYDKDPNKFPDAKPFEKLSWPEFRSLVGDEWQPGMNAPFDPVAAKKAEELGVKVVILDGNDFLNVEKYFKGEPFVGTTIE